MKATIVASFVLLLSNIVVAEPYFAVREGLNCSNCHVNPTGGGLRNSFGNLYGQNTLPVTAFKSDSPWTGQIAGPILLGGNGRYTTRYFDVDNIDTNTNFAVDRATLYVGAELSDNISFMLDQQVAPNGSVNRESWLKLNYGNTYVKAGKLFRPFGWRLEDDSAFVRQVTGINFTAGDNGVEFGYERGGWSSQLAVTNGSGGGEIDDGKQVSWRLSRATNNLQWGINANVNNTDAGERRIGGIFVGVNTGPITWLGEWDRIDDSDFAADADQDLGLLEANYLVRKGHNLKLTVEAQRFDDGANEDRMRYSLVYEYFPMAFSQLRLGVRERDSDDPNALLNSQEWFAQLHVYF